MIATWYGPRFVQKERHSSWLLSAGLIFLLSQELSLWSVLIQQTVFTKLNFLLLSYHLSNLFNSLEDTKKGVEELRFLLLFINNKVLIGLFQWPNTTLGFLLHFNFTTTIKSTLTYSANCSNPHHCERFENLSIAECFLLMHCASHSHSR